MCISWRNKSPNQQFAHKDSHVASSPLWYTSLFFQNNWTITGKRSDSFPKIFYLYAQNTLFTVAVYSINTFRLCYVSYNDFFSDHITRTLFHYQLALRRREFFQMLATNTKYSYSFLNGHIITLLPCHSSQLRITTKIQ